MDSGVDGVDGAELSIGGFARRVGLTPSALRFYDDCGLLRPHRVDAVSGYRYYTTAQEPRARLLSDLRRAALPLPEAREVLDGPGPAARRVLEAHLDRTDAAAAATRETVRRVLGDLDPPSAPSARVDGLELAGAIRQVAPAALTSADPGGPDVLRGVLVELADGEVRLVATDRFRLSVRVLRPAEAHGGPARAVVHVDGLTALTTWLTRADAVTVEVAGTGLVLTDGRTRRPLAGSGGAFPDYRMVLDGLGPPRTRLVAGRTDLGAVLEERAGAPYARLTASAGELRVTAPGHPEAALPAVRTGDAPDVAFAPSVLGASLAAGIGPDVLLEIAGPAEPAVVRSADQGTFTTLAMPVRIAPDEAPGRPG